MDLSVAALIDQNESLPKFLRDLDIRIDLSIIVCGACYRSENDMASELVERFSPDTNILVVRGSELWSLVARRIRREIFTGKRIIGTDSAIVND